MLLKFLENLGQVNGISLKFLHIIYNNRKASIYLEDGKSDLLDRYVNLDDGSMYYTMGKQIGGKPIDPDGKLGQELLRIADYWINNPDTDWKPLLSSGCMACVLFFLIIPVLVLFL